MSPFIPKLALIQRNALSYPLGNELMKRFEARGIRTLVYEKRVPVSSHETFREGFLAAKRTIVVLVWQRREFQTCKPSAHYQLPLTSGCPGLCQYCYLNTNLGRRPYIKVYVNVDDILNQAREYVDERRPETTIFEGAATSDPISVESWTGSIQKAVKFFAFLNDARFRFVTKYTDIDGLLGVDHRGKTEIRFSINCDSVIERFETGAPRLRFRLEAAKKVLEAGYPFGFLIGPIFAFRGWREEYGRLLDTVKEYIPGGNPVTFELITHRFTTRSRGIIQQAYPGTGVPLDEKERRFKYGQFGYGKYVYPDDLMAELREFFHARIEKTFPQGTILYMV